jgi:hypothetical protein
MKYSFLLFLVWLILGSCTPKALSYLNTENANLSSYRTYRLLNTKLERTNLSKEGRAILDILETEINEQMRKRGYELSNLNPDLLLRYEISTNIQTNVNQNFNPYGAPMSTSTFRESVIIVDLMDAEKRKMFWQASYDMEDQSRQLQREQATEAAVHEIFYTYPHMARTDSTNEELADFKAGRKALKVKHKQEKKEAKKQEKALKKEQRRK